MIKTLLDANVLLLKSAALLTSVKEEIENSFSIPKEEVRKTYKAFLRERQKASTQIEKVSLGARIALLQELFGEDNLLEQT